LIDVPARTEDAKGSWRKASREEAFAAYFSDTLGRVQALALRITRNPWDAEDVAVEAFARAYARWDRLAEAEWRTGWVLKVAGNLSIDVVRRRRGTARMGLDRDGDGAPSERLLQVVDDAGSTVDRLVLTAALRQLPRREQEVVVLIGLCGCSHEHAAGVLGISTGSTKTYLHRAMGHLRSELGADGGPGGELAHVIE
jgi:RNA polymerase sigma-70 factor (ECF subfamily)